jgi:hypothetical protein
VPQGAKDICETATVEYPNPTVSGTISFKADKTFTQTSTASGQGFLVLDKSCLQQGSTTLTCTQIQQAIESNSGTKTTCTAANGGCRCGGTMQQSTTDNGTYAASGTSVTLTGKSSELSSPYCVKGTDLYLKLNLSTETEGGAPFELTGQLVLTK